MTSSTWRPSFAQMWRRATSTPAAPVVTPAAAPVAATNPVNPASAIPYGFDASIDETDGNEKLVITITAGELFALCDAHTAGLDREQIPRRTDITRFLTDVANRMQHRRHGGIWTPLEHFLLETVLGSPMARALHVVQPAAVPDAVQQPVVCNRPERLIQIDQPDPEKAG